MTEARVLADAEFLDVLHSFEHTAFRLELQEVSVAPEEDELFAAFLRGDRVDTLAVPALAEWYRRVADHVRAGKRVERVRVQQDPPSDYQRLERATDRWNIEAGEVIRYLTVRRAYEIGLLPAAGDTDWWLLDSSRLLVMRFEHGRLVQSELITDPATVIQACRWRDLAVHHSVLSVDRHPAA